MRVLDLNPFFLEGGSTGCVLVRGFSGSPPEMRPMGEYLTGQGLTVLGVRLAGHGTIPEDMACTDWREWVASAEEGLQELQRRCDPVFLAGLSRGGLIALYLVAHHPVAGAIAMSSPAYIADWRFRLLPLVQPFVCWVAANEEWDLTDPEAQALLSAHTRLPTRVVVSLRQFLPLVQQGLPYVQVPVLLMQGRCDRTIPPDSARIVFNGLGTLDKETAWFDNSGHCITIDSEREAVWSRVHEFIIAHSEQE